MSRIIQRNGRKGYYLQVVVPRELREIIRTSAIVRKLSDDKDESLKIKKQVEEQIINKFDEIKFKHKFKKNASNNFIDESLKRKLYEKIGHHFFEPSNELNEKGIVLSYWHCIGHEVDFKEINSYQIIKFFNAEVIVHNYRGKLWAFENCCPHRGAKFLKKNLSTAQITCPYHGWTFTPYSSYIPRKDTFPEINSISEVRPKVWKIENINGFIFISYKPLFTLHDQLGKEVVNIISEIGQSINKNYSSQEIIFNCDWKIAIENALEPYHVSFVHKDTLAPLGISDGKNIFYDWASIFKDKIKSKKVKNSKKIFEKMLNIKYNFDGYWSLYLYPFSMISSTEATTFAHQFYQPYENGNKTSCLTKLWCLETAKDQYEETLNNFYKSVSETNLKIFQEDAEICSYVNEGMWNKKPLFFKSTLEAKVDHFRNCIRKFENLLKK